MMYPKEFVGFEPVSLVNTHRQLHYNYVNLSFESHEERVEIESAHTSLVAAMKEQGVGHVVTDELDATLPEILQNIHVSVYYESMRLVRVDFISDFSRVVDKLVGKKILDIGCGIGLAMRILENSGLEVQGLDNSPSAIYYCKNKGLTVRRGDAERLPFSDESFDMSFSLHVLEYIIDFKRAIQESLRVSKSRVVHVVSLGRQDGVSSVNVWGSGKDLLLDVGSGLLVMGKHSAEDLGRAVVLTIEK